MYELQLSNKLNWKLISIFEWKLRYLKELKFSKFASKF